MVTNLTPPISISNHPVSNPLQLKCKCVSHNIISPNTLKKQQIQSSFIHDSFKVDSRDQIAEQNTKSSVDIIVVGAGLSGIYAAIAAIEKEGVQSVVVLNGPTEAAHPLSRGVFTTRAKGPTHSTKRDTDITRPTIYFGIYGRKLVIRSTKLPSANSTRRVSLG